MQTHSPPLVVKPVMVRLAPDSYLWLQQQAAQQERSANWIMNKMVEEARAKHAAAHPQGAQA